MSVGETTFLKSMQILNTKLGMNINIYLEQEITINALVP